MYAGTKLIGAWLRKVLVFPECLVNLDEGYSVHVGHKMGFQKTWSCFSIFCSLKLQKKMCLHVNIQLFVVQTRRQYVLYAN